MANMKIDPLFWFFIIIFVITNVFLVRAFDVQWTNDLKYHLTSINSIVKGKNVVINDLSHQLVEQENENEDLRNTLAETRNGLEALSQKFTQPISVAAPASVSASAAVTK